MMKQFKWIFFTKLTAIIVLIIFSFSLLIPSIGITNDATFLGVTSVKNELNHQVYAGNFTAETFVEPMTIQPIITPDNAEDVLVRLIDSANQSIELDLQYIKLFNSSSDSDWPTDENPLVRAVVRAINRGVNVRVILNAEFDNDNASTYLTSVGAQVRFMDLGTDLPSKTHNKGIIIDNKTVVIASINWSKSSLRSNREAGVIIHDNENVAGYYLEVFNYDWERSQPASLVSVSSVSLDTSSTSSLHDNGGKPLETNQLVSETIFDAPKHSGTFNVTTFVGPDSTHDTVFQYLDTAKQSIHVEIYAISLDAIVDKLISLKESNPTLDIKIIISDRRASIFENINTWEAALRLVQNGIPVYNSSDQFLYQHSKFWIIDGKSTFVYSGNWARSSIPESSTYSGANREWGIVLNDESLSSYYEQVFQNDLSIAEPFKPDLLAANKILDIIDGSILSGTHQLRVAGQNISQVTVSIDDVALGSMDVNPEKTLATFTLDTTQYQNGIHVISFNVISDDGTSQILTVETNIINEEPQWKLLITEVLYNAENEPEEEFIEITNLFNFTIIIANWKFIDLETTNDTFVFPANTKINSGQGIIITRDANAFRSKFGFDPSFEFNELSLRNSGDEAILESADGAMMDAVTWGTGRAIPGVQPFTGDANNGESIQRTPIYQDTNDCNKDFKPGPPDPQLSVSLEDISTNLSTITELTPWFNGIENLLVFGALISLISVVRKRKRGYN